MSLSLTKIDKNEYKYNRSSSIEYDKLCLNISSKYGNNKCIVTPSGMSAIDLVFNSIFVENKWKSINIIYSWELYCDTPLLFEYYKKMYTNMDLTLYEVPISSNIYDNERIIDLFENKVKNEINIFYVESCSNMSGWFFDIDIITQMRQLSKKLYFIIDNTWLTSTIFNPFMYDVDITVISLSKHYSGGHCISGALICKNREYYEIAKNYYTIKGYHVSTHVCTTILDNINLMKERLIKTSNIANDVANYLKKQKQVSEVSYPLLENHASYRLKNQYFKLIVDGKIIGPDVFSFAIDEKENVLIKKLKSMNILNLKTSYGGGDSRIESTPIEISNKTWCRISIGYNDNYEKIIKGLNEIFVPF